MSFMKVEDVSKQLEEGLKNIFESKRFLELLNVMASQKNYSFNNTLMIAFQKPEATMVMGFKEWQKQGRHVNAGEKGIKILAPLIKQMEMEKIDPKTQKPQIDNKGNIVTSIQPVITGFRLVSVFDVSQTDGKEIPSVRDFINRQLKDDAYMSELYKEYKGFLNINSGLDIREDVTEKGVGGYFAPKTNEIVVSNTENKNDTEKFRVLIHEYAHALLHGMDKEFREVDRGHKEAQAESVAYVVSSYYGLDISDISHGYIATWSKDMALAKRAIEEIQKVSNTIIDEIQLLQKDKINEFEKGQNNNVEKIKDFLLDTYGLTKEAFIKDGNSTVFQLLNKENGIVMTATLGFSEKNDSYYLRTNRNMIHSLGEIMPEGRLSILNIQKENGVLNQNYKSLNEKFIVDKEQETYVIKEHNTGNPVSKIFETKEAATEFLLRAAIGQSLINKSFLQKETPDRLEIAEKGITEAVSKFFSYHEKKELILSEGNQSEKIAWALLKNPTLKTTNDLENFIKEHQHVNSYKNIEINVKQKEPELVR